MLHSPRRALVAALLLLGLGQAWLAAVEVPEVPIAQASRYEGQEVVVQGLVRSATRFDDEARLVLASDGYGLKVQTTDLTIQQGSLVRAEGRLVRFGTDLVLLATSVKGEAPPSALPVSLDALLDQSPDQLVRVTGTIQDGYLIQHGTRVQLGQGPWPESGRVSAVATAMQDPSCACLRLHAHSVQPWTE